MTCLHMAFINNLLKQHKIDFLTQYSIPSILCSMCHSKCIIYQIVTQCINNTWLQAFLSYSMDSCLYITFKQDILNKITPKSHFQSKDYNFILCNFFVNLFRDFFLKTNFAKTCDLKTTPRLKVSKKHIWHKF